MAASILGVMGAFGFVLNQLEGKYERYKKNKVISQSFKLLIRSTSSLSDKNFASLSKSDINPASRSAIDLSSLEYFNIMMNSAISEDNLQGSSTNRGTEYQLKSS